MSTYRNGYKLTKRRINHVTKTETFYFKKDVGQYMTITITEGSEVTQEFSV